MITIIIGAFNRISAKKQMQDLITSLAEQHIQISKVNYVTMIFETSCCCIRFVSYDPITFRGLRADYAIGFTDEISQYLTYGNKSTDKELSAYDIIMKNEKEGRKNA